MYTKYNRHDDKLETQNVVSLMTSTVCITATFNLGMGNKEQNKMS